MTKAARWSIVLVILVCALIAALWHSLSPAPAPTVRPDGGSQARPAEPSRGGDYVPASEADRAGSGLAACPPAQNAAGPKTPAQRHRLVCMADGEPRTFADLRSGAPTLINLWAYWCEPCRRELPALREAQHRLGTRTKVMLVHVDPAEPEGIAALKRLGVTELPAAQDPDGRLPIDLGAPPVLPISVFVRGDGSIAKVLAQPLDTTEEVLDAVRTYLGPEAAP